MAYPYGTRLGPVTGAVAPGLPRTIGELRGEWAFAQPGTYLVTVPDGVTSISTVTGGAGGGSFALGSVGNFTVSAGAGGGLAYTNSVPVNPGDVLQIVVGAGGINSTNGGNSTITNLTSGVVICSAGGGANGTIAASNAIAGGILVGDGGGLGGAGMYSNQASQCSASGGAAAGYSGKGGDGTIVSFSAGTGGGGASGTGSSSAVNGSGGVGMFGEGPSGSTSGAGGSGGENGAAIAGTGQGYVGRPGNFCAGAGAACTGTTASTTNAGTGACGFARIVYGEGRRFPSSDVGPS